MMRLVEGCGLMPAGRFVISAGMEHKAAVEAFSALGQSTRLKILELLASKAPDGIPAGDIARSLDATPSNLSVHLTLLTRAGLIAPERRGRSIIYRADLDTVRALTLYLIEDCCHGRPEICASLLKDIQARHPTKPRKPH